MKFTFYKSISKSYVRNHLLFTLMVIQSGLLPLIANSGNGQSILSKNISIKAENEILKNVLDKIEVQAKVRFTYNNQSINDQQRITFQSNNSPLRSVMDEMLQPIGIRYEIFNEKNIVLTKSMPGISGQIETLDPIKGKILDKDGNPLIGANIQIKGTNEGSSTDSDGNFEINSKIGDILVVSYTGYNTLEYSVTNLDNINITLSESATMLESVVIVGSRSNAARSRTETVAPVDVLTARELAQTGQTDPTQMLHFVAPSFNSSRQTVADGTDHIDPATLRGLGPDQVLMLLNGKRRHNQALININGTVGRGSVGTDMNAIPSAAIERLEVLRDGAASQYGSDAIAGVINVVMRNSVGTSVTGHYGGYNTSYEPIFGSDTKRKMTDGQNLQLSIYHGMKLSEKGRISFAAEFRDRQSSNRAGDFTGTVFNTNKTIDDGLIAQNGGFDRTFNMQVGNASSRNFLASINFNYQLGAKSELYLNTNYAARSGAGKGFYRYPKQTTQVIPELYPRGFLPEIHSTLNDFSLLAGVKGTLANGWKWDLSNVFGSNNFRFDVKNSNNASQFAQGAKAQTEFYAGTLGFAQNTVNFDISKGLSVSSLKSLNLAFGAEYRLDMYQIQAGEEASWKNYAPTANPIRVGGSQVFPGFQPSNETDESRNVLAAYADIESDITDKFLVNAAARIENYSDFGSNVAGKLAARYKLADEFILRGAVSNGFRAPSIHQRYFSNTSTQFIVADGQTVPRNVGTFRNESAIAQALGIPSLGPETSTNLSLGVTSKLGNSFTVTVDGYQIDIKNRVVLTGNIARTSGGLVDNLLKAGNVPPDVTSVAFFTNAIDTRTRGIDIVMATTQKIGSGSLDITAGANFNQTEIIGTPKTTDKLPQDAFGKTFFSRIEESRIVAGQPRNKVSLGLTYRLKDLNIMLRGTNFGQVEIWDAAKPELDEIQSPKTVIDLSIGYRFMKKITFTLGANNLTDVYPDKIKNFGNTSDGRFIYSRNVTQFGFGGRYLYSALRIDL